MPCFSPPGGLDYPEYLKKIFKEIETLKDEEAKNCICKLKVPTTEDGCAITDEDDKIVIFPFCLPEEPPIFADGFGQANSEFYSADLGLSYKKAMQTYWNKKPFKIKFEAKGYSPPQPESDCEDGWSSDASTKIFDISKFTLKDLVCKTGKGVAIDDDTPSSSPGYTLRNDAGDCRYDPEGDTSYYFGVEFIIFAPYFYNNEYVQAWIDKEEEKIYPIIYAKQNLGGCCGALGPVDIKEEGTKIIINTISKSATFSGNGSGGKGKIEITNFIPT